jgi:hypothetical protein
MKRDLTWLAILCGFVLSLVGQAPGWLGGQVYFFVTGHLLSGGPLDWFTGGAVGRALQELFPTAIQGAIAGGLAMWLTSKAIKNARYDVVSYAFASVTVAFGVLTIILDLAMNGASLMTLMILANGGATAFSGYSVAEEAAQRRSSALTAAA